MKHDRTRILLLFWLITLFFATPSQGQNYPVQAGLTLLPPYSIRLSDYASPASEKVLVNLFLKDLATRETTVKLRVTIAGPGIILQTRQGFSGTPIDLFGGTATILNSQDLAEYFDPDHLDFIGLSKNAFMKTGTLPEGAYRISVEAIDFNRETTVSNKADAVGWFILNDPPLITSPAADEKLRGQDPQNILFQWSPGHAGSPNAAFTTEYSFQLLELWPATLNPNDAFQTSPLLHETTTLNTSLLYGPDAPLLEPGKTYAFRVQAVPLTGTPETALFRNNGYSEVVRFVYDDPCDYPGDITIARTAHDKTALEWQENVNNTRFTVLYKEDEGNANEWYEADTYMGKIQLTGLQPSTPYTYKIMSECGPFTSVYSPLGYFSTGEAPEILLNCNKPPDRYDLSRTTLLQSQKAGDTFMAGDFSVKVHESRKNNPSTFSGRGAIETPFFKQARALVIFENISINASGRLVEGQVDVTGGVIGLPEELKDVLDSVDVLLTKAEEILTVAEMVHDTIVALTGTKTDETLPSDSTSQELASLASIEEITDSLSSDTTIDQQSLTEINGDYQNDSTRVLTEESTPETSFSDASTTGSPPTGNTNSTLEATTDTLANSTLSKDLRFGPIAVTLSSTPDPEKTDDEGYCHYNNLTCSIAVTIESSYYTFSLPMEFVSLSFKKHCDKNSYKDVTFQWQGNIKAKPMGWLAVNITGANLTVSPDGNVAGDITFQPDVVLPENLGSLVQVQGLAEAEIIYRFNNTNNFSGAFDFSGLDALDITLSHGKTLLHEMTGITFNESGEIFMDLQKEGPWQLGTTTLYSMDVEASLTLWEGFRLHRGHMELGLDNIPGFLTAPRAVLSIENGITTTVLNSDSIKVFGMELSNTALSLVMDENFEITSLSGNFEASHPDFDTSLKVSYFDFSDGILKAFTASGRVAYQGLDITVQESHYDPAQQSLLLNALVTIKQGENTASAQLNGFSIKTDGTITMGEYQVDADLNQSFGPIRLIFASHPSPNGKKEGQYQVYQDNEATIFLAMKEGEEIHEKEIARALVSFKKTKNGEWKDFKARWTGENIAVGTVKSLETFITSFDLSLESIENPVLKGTAWARTKLMADVKLSEIDKGFISDTGFDVIIRKGMEGTSKFTFDASSRDFEGEWTLLTLKNMDVHLLKNKQAICKLDNALYSEEGKISGTLSALPSAEFTSAYGRVKVKKVELGMSFYPFSKEKQFKLLKGTGNFELTGLKGIQGTVFLNSNFDEENIISTVDLKTHLTAFGMTLSDFEVTLSLNRQFDLQSIEGQVKGKHDLFNTTIEITKFLYEQQGLTTFEAKNVSVSYQGFDFELNNLSYTGSYLDISAKVALGLSGSDARMAVDHFVIDTTGNISVGKISGRLDKNPIMMQFEAVFSENRFQGEFDGEFGKFFSLQGVIDVGSREDYTFGYLALKSSANIPIAPGFKISSLSGNLGYHYTLRYDKTQRKFLGGPMKDNYVVGFGLGIADQANLMELFGNPILQFGKEKIELSLVGELSVPKNDPNFKGELVVNYNITDNVVDGTLSSNIAFPAKSGAILKGTDLGFDFKYADTGWEIQGQDLSASVFNKLQFSGGISLTGSTGKPFEGSLLGRFDFDYHYTFKGDYTVGSLEASLDLAIKASAVLTLKENDLEGKISSTINGAMALKVTSALLGTVEVASSFDGQAEIERSDNRNNLSARVDFQLEVLSTQWDYSKDIAVEL